MTNFCTVLYGNQAHEIKNKLGLKDGDETTVPLKVTFQYKDVEGRSKLYVCAEV